MATYTPVVDVNITINVVRLAQAGFGIPLFVDATNKFSERTTGLLTSPDDLLEAEWGFTTSSPAYRAATQLYAQSPSVEGFKIGRRAALFNGQPTDVQGTGSTHAFTLSVSGSGVSDVPVTYTTSGGSETEFDVCTAFKATIDSSPLNSFVTAEVSGAGSAARLVVRCADNEEPFLITFGTSDNFTGEYQGEETAANCMAAIRDYDDEWYFLATHDRDVTWVDQISEYIQSTAEVDPNTPSYGKMYFQASSDVTNIDKPYDGDNPSYSVFGLLRSKNRTRTVNFFHQSADANYPECAYIGVNAPYNAGSVIWSNIVLNGLAPSAHPVTGRRLTSGQKSNLASNNANFIETDAGVDVVRDGITASQEWIDIIRGVDWLTQEIELAIKRLLFQQKGKKINYTDQGIAQVREVIHTALQSAVNRNFLQSFELKVPLLADILATSTGKTNWINRVLADVTFVGYLAGAINTVTVNGSVEAPTAASLT